MVNFGYTPRHSAAPAIKVPGRPEKAAEPRVPVSRRPPGGHRAQIGIISATAVALLAIVTFLAVRSSPEDVTASCAQGTSGPGCAAPAGRSSAASAQTSVPSVHMFRGRRYSFDSPSAILAGAGVWVTNVLGDTVTRLPAATGGKVLTLPSGYGFDGPNALALGHGDLWIANVPANSITEVSASTGKYIRTLSAGYGFSSPYALLLYGKRLWVTDAASDSITEINAVTGHLLHTFGGGNYRFDNPYALAVAGGHLWVANSGGDSVTEMNAVTGAWVRTLAVGYQLNDPTSLIAADGQLWVANEAGDTLTEISTSTARLIRVLPGRQYGLDNPAAIALSGGVIWVANALGNSVSGQVSLPRPHRHHRGREHDLGYQPGRRLRHPAAGALRKSAALSNALRARPCAAGSSARPSRPVPAARRSAAGKR
jgi:hypothetical protein